MTSILRTLVLASVALMAATSGKHDVGAPAGGGLGVTRFVCAHCTATGQLYNMSCNTLDMYHMILKHHETMPLSEKSFDVR